MTTSDLPDFHDLFRALQSVFALRGTERELEHLEATYFRVLRRFALEDVTAGAEACLAHSTRFPKPAAWVEAVPKRVLAPADCRLMSLTEAREYHHARVFKGEQGPCTCDACVAAGVSDKPLQFVPDVDDDDRNEQAFDPIGKRLVVTGHWAHGAELARYYAAKDAFFETWFTSPLSTTPRSSRAERRLARQLRQVGEEPLRDRPLSLILRDAVHQSEREPGEDDA